MNIIYNQFLYDILKKTTDLTTDTVKVRLHTVSYVPNKDHNTIADLTNEVVGRGYTSGGKILTGKTVTKDDANDCAVFDADDVVWSTSWITARYAILVNTTNSDHLICCIDFEEDYISTGGDFKIEWNPNVILKLSM